MTKNVKINVLQSLGSSRFALIARCIGIIVTIACVVFVGFELLENEAILASSVWSRSVLVAILVAAVLWVGVNAALGVGWMALVRALGVEAGMRESLMIAMISQVAKYLPGNVFHLAGRVWHARQAGLPTKQSTLATAGESLLLVSVALLIGFPLLIALPHGESVALGLLVAGFIVGWLAVKNRAMFVKAGAVAKPRELSSVVRWISISVIAYGFVFLIQTAMFMALSRAASVEFDWGMLTGFQVVAVTWLAGFVVVGSPGGIGVREAAFAFFAESQEMRSNLMLVAALMRVSSILGDCISFAIGQRLKKGIGRVRAENEESR